jgi:hypothetical protein
MSYHVFDDIKTKTNELKEQGIMPKYVSFNTKGFTLMMEEEHYKVPTYLFGLEVLYNPQQITLVRIIAETPEQDFLRREEKYL